MESGLLFTLNKKADIAYSLIRLLSFIQETAQSSEKWERDTKKAMIGGHTKRAAGFIRSGIKRNDCWPQEPDHQGYSTDCIANRKYPISAKQSEAEDQEI